MSAYMGKELILFVKSLWYGAVLLFTYDCLRILRRVFQHSAGVVAFEDLLFWSGSSLFLFSRFFRENSGVLRTYMFVGVASGVLAWYFSLSSFFITFTSGWIKKGKEKILILAKRLKFWIARCRISLDMRRCSRRQRENPDRGAEYEKKKSAKRRKNKKMNRQNIQNRAAMLGISGVVCLLLLILLVKGDSLQEKIAANENRKDQLMKQLEEEEARTGEIEDLQEYMKSEEYIEKIAKEKIGLVKENEIIFKENK